MKSSMGRAGATSLDDKVAPCVSGFTLGDVTSHVAISSEISDPEAKGPASAHQG